MSLNKRYATTFASVSKPGIGLYEDVEKLHSNFLAKVTMRYEEFSDIWKTMRMPYILSGRTRSSELRESIDVSLNAGLSLFTSSTSPQTRACGIYVMYAFYETQPINPKSKIRVTPLLWESLRAFVKCMSDEEHYDLAYIFTRLRMAKAFQFVATLTERGVTKRTSDKELRPISPPRVVSTFQDISVDILEDLSAVHEEYQRLKICVSNPGGNKPHPSMDMAKQDFIQDITKNLTRFDEWRKTGKCFKKATSTKRKHNRCNGASSGQESESSGHSDSESAPESDRHQLTVLEKRKQLRDKAFASTGTTSRSRRHRQMEVESSPSDSDWLGSPTKKRKLKTNTTKNKSLKSGKKKTQQKPKSVQQESLDATNAYLMIATATNSQKRKSQMTPNK